MKGLVVEVLKGQFSVCKVEDTADLPLHDDFCFVGKTDQEISLVCLTAHVPLHTAEREDGWKAMRIRGVLEFSLVGILSRLSTLLAEHGISIFAISTYDTDYLLVKEQSVDQAAAALQEAGFQIVGS